MPVMGLIARGLLLLGGVIAGFFVAKDADNYAFVSFVAGMVLFVLFVALVTFWPAIKGGLRALMGRKRK